MRRLLTPATVMLVNQLPTAVGWSDRPTRPQPERERRRHLTRVVRIVDQWRYDGYWWEENEVQRDYFFLELDRGVKLELFREGEDWWVARLND